MSESLPKMKPPALASPLPDHVWLNIFEIGVNKSKLDINDLSSLSVCCKNFCRLSIEDSLWSTLLALDFPSEPHTHYNDLPDLLPSPPFFSSQKALYKHKLHNQLKRKLVSMERRVAEDEFELRLVTELMIRSGRSRAKLDQMKTNIQELDAQLQEIMNETERPQTREIQERLGALKVRRDKLIPKVVKMEEWWMFVAKSSGLREHSVQSDAIAAIQSLAVCMSSHLPSGPSSGTPAGSRPFGDVFVRLQMVMHDLSSDRQEDIWIRQQLVPPIMDDLLQRRQKHMKQLDVLTRRLVLFSTGSNSVEIDSDEMVNINTADADGDCDLEAALDD